MLVAGIGQLIASIVYVVWLVQLGIGDIDNDTGIWVTAGISLGYALFIGKHRNTCTYLGACACACVCACACMCMRVCMYLPAAPLPPSPLQTSHTATPNPYAGGITILGGGWTTRG